MGGQQGLKKPKQLATKLSRYILISILVVFGILITVIGITTTKDLSEREREKLTLLSSENASESKKVMEDMLNKQSVIISAVKSLRSLPAAEKLDTLTKIITETKADEPNVLSIFLVAEPNRLLEETPNGYSIFATNAGTTHDYEMFTNVNEELYNNAKASKAMMIVDPFHKIIDGVEYMVITVLQPVFDDANNVTAMIGSNINVETLANANYDNGGYKSFYNEIICGHQTIIMHGLHPDRVGEKFIDVTTSTHAQEILDSANSPDPYIILDTEKDGVTKSYKTFVPFYIPGSSVVWLSASVISEAEFNASIVQQIMLVVAVLIASLVVLAFVIFLRIKKTLKPIIHLDEVATAISKGNLQMETTFHSDDEMGSLAHSLRNSTNILHAYVSDIDRAMAQMADGNFDLAPSQPFIGDFKPIENSIGKLITDMSHTIRMITQSADQVASGSDQVSSGAQELSQSASQQASAVEELSTQIAEISEHIKNNADNAATANDLAGSVGEEINTSNQQMSEMMHAMSDISDSSLQISKIIKTIEDIAFQTNILALNAAVEAARAGTAGKGFAVVADEVRSLATKSSEAAKQTNVLIAASVKSVENGVKIAGQTAKSLSSVVTGAEQITGIIAKISEASANQSSSITQINLSVRDISNGVQTNSSTSEESAAASEELSGQANVMKQLVSRFKIKDEGINL